jgi:glycosyltransferase involved in cell wall biosynthesis
MEIHLNKLMMMHIKIYMNKLDHLPNVNYIGYKPHEYIRENLHKYHIFAFPSIWEETFCISALEAMAAGLYCITTDYGALYETGAEFITYVPYEKSFTSLAHKFAYAIEHAAGTLDHPAIRQHLDMQIDYVNRFYNWDKIGYAWTNLIKGAINARRK